MIKIAHLFTFLFFEYIIFKIFSTYSSITTFIFLTSFNILMYFLMINISLSIFYKELDKTENKYVGKVNKRFFPFFLFLQQFSGMIVMIFPFFILFQYFDNIFVPLILTFFLVILILIFLKIISPIMKYLPLLSDKDAKFEIDHKLEKSNID